MLLPRPLWCWVGVGVDGCWRRVRVGGHSRVGVRRVCRCGILRHDVGLAVGGRVDGGGGGRGRGGQVEVEWGGRSRRGGGCRWRRDPLQYDVRVELGIRAVKSMHGGLQQTLLTPVSREEECTQFWKMGLTENVRDEKQQLLLDIKTSELAGLCMLQNENLCVPKKCSPL